MTATEAPPVEPQTDDRPPLAPTRPTTPTPAERQAHALARGADATTPHALNGRADSLADQLTHTIDVRPRQAWRRWLGRPADRPTLAEAEAIAEMREPLDRPASVVVASVKGGVGKTSLTIGLGSAFAEALGGGVAALDNNELRGTLADRVAREPHDRTIGDLIAPPAADGRFNLDWWRSPDATSLQMRWNAHAQPCGLHVYGSDPHMDATVGIPALHYSLLADAISRFYPITIVDTGNSEVAPNWRAALALADVIVVPVKLRIDFLLPAARMLESLRAHGHHLDGRVVIAISNGGMTVAPEAQQAADDWFAGFPVVNIPFDQLIDSPHPIVWDRLQATTRAAYRQLGATTRRAITTQKEN